MDDEEEDFRVSGICPVCQFDLIYDEEPSGPDLHRYWSCDCGFEHDEVVPYKGGH